MSYLFSNPQAKRWRAIFLISFAVNIVLFAGFMMARSEISANSEKIKSVSTELEACKTSLKENEPKEGDAASIASEQKTVVEKGEPVFAKIAIVDNFYSSFVNSEKIAEMAEKLAVPNLAELLSAHVSRLIVWDVDLRKDLRQGDELKILFKTLSEKEIRERNDIPDSIEILAVEYYSQKQQRNISIYKFHEKGDEYSRYYYKDGNCIDKIIKPKVMDDYIQVTSMLKDRSPKHEGIDFKTPVGTHVYATKNGKVTRINWKVKYNGYCIEVKVDGKDEYLKYLHLSDILVKPGQRLKIGDHIANSGNTGRSTAPHLHYQVNRGNPGKVLNPFVYHETYNKHISDGNKTDFEEMIHNVDNIFVKE